MKILQNVLNVVAGITLSAVSALAIASVGLVVFLVFYVGVK